MPHNPNVSYGVAALIICGGVKGGEDRYLLLKRKGSHASGVWSTVGGWVEMDETPEQAIVREVKEEVGITVTNLRFTQYETEVHELPDGSRVQSLTLYFIIIAYEGKPQILEPEKCSELRWATERDILADKESNYFPHLQSVIKSVANEWS